MNARRMAWIGWMVALALAAPAVSASVDAGTAKYSGTIISVNEAAGTIVLGEVGPWRVEDGATKIIERTIAVSGATEIRQAKRHRGPGPTGWIGDFVEVPIPATELTAGDFVTVHVLADGQHLTAVKIVVVAGSGS